MQKILNGIIILILCFALMPESHMIQQIAAEVASGNVYGPYQFLIGEWDVSRDDQPPAMLMRFSWGPKQSYIWCSASMLQNGKEIPHFEGLLVWNGVRKNLDMLIALGLDGPGEEEQGTVYINSDGTIVRDITGISDRGTQHFRQTFKATSADRVITTVMHETKDGWAPTFPGSDNLIMSRRKNAE